MPLFDVKTRCCLHRGSAVVVGRIASVEGGIIHFMTPHGTTIELGLLYADTIGTLDKPNEHRLQELELDAANKLGMVYREPVPPQYHPV